MKELKNTNIIINSEFFNEIYGKLEKLEKNRIYCKHDMEHFLAVARIMRIMALEENLNFDPDLIYSAAIIHDLGRTLEYEENIEHRLAGLAISDKLLALTDFGLKEKEIIREVIKNHGKEDSLFLKLFTKADKISRNCFLCKARSTCKWSDEKKNKVITY